MCKKLLPKQRIYIYVYNHIRIPKCVVLTPTVQGLSLNSCDGNCICVGNGFEDVTAPSAVILKTTC